MSYHSLRSPLHRTSAYSFYEAMLGEMENVVTPRYSLYLHVVQLQPPICEQSWSDCQAQSAVCRTYLEPAWTYEPMAPSEATRPAFLSADARPFLRRNSVAISRLLSLLAKAFLQSIMPAPLLSRSCFTSLASTCSQHHTVPPVCYTTCCLAAAALGWPSSATQPCHAQKCHTGLT